MPTLRVIKNGTSFTFRGTGKLDKEGDECVGELQIPDDLMPVLRDAKTGIQVVGYYKKAFEGVTGLADTIDMLDSEPLRQVLAIVVPAAEAARMAYSSQEFELGAAPEQG